MKIIFSLFFIILFISCKKDDPTPTSIQFNGITPTDINGNFTGPKDETDWGFQGNWDERAVELFSNTMTSECSEKEDYGAYAATPNPVMNQMVLGYRLKDSADLEVRIVDRNFNLLKSTDAVNVFGPGYNSLSLDVSGVSIRDTVRVYYKIYNEDCELRGSGDVILL